MVHIENHHKAELWWIDYCHSTHRWILRQWTGPEKAFRVKHCQFELDTQSRDGRIVGYGVLRTEQKYIESVSDDCCYLIWARLQPPTQVLDPEPILMRGRAPNIGGG